LGRLYPELQQAGAEVFVVIPGKPERAKRYREIVGLPFAVLADPGGAVYREYAVGRWMLGLLRQSAVVVIDTAGNIVHRQVVDSPGGMEPMDDVLDRVRQLQQSEGTGDASTSGK